MLTKKTKTKKNKKQKMFLLDSDFFSSEMKNFLPMKAAANNKTILIIAILFKLRSEIKKTLGELTHLRVFHFLLGQGFENFSERISFPPWFFFRISRILWEMILKNTQTIFEFPEWFLKKIERIPTTLFLFYFFYSPFIFCLIKKDIRSFLQVQNTQCFLVIFFILQHQTSSLDTAISFNCKKIVHCILKWC